METIDSSKLILRYPRENIVQVTPREGVTVDEEAAKDMIRAFEPFGDRDFGMIIDRENDYAVSPVAVYNILNEAPGFKAIAVTTHMEPQSTLDQMVQSLFKGQVAVFNSIEEATHWLESVLAPKQGN